VLIPSIRPRTSANTISRKSYCRLFCPRSSLLCLLFSFRFCCCSLPRRLTTLSRFHVCTIEFSHGTTNSWFASEWLPFHIRCNLTDGCCSVLIFFCIGVSALQSFLTSFGQQLTNVVPLVASYIPACAPFFVGWRECSQYICPKLD
jgi:hypothetical protein